MKNKLSIISFILTFIGGSIFGICIVLSEILYPNIDEFVNTPFEYQICFFISIFIAFVGIIMSIFFRNKANKLIEIYKDLIDKFLIYSSYCEKDYDKIIENNISEIRQCDLKLYEIEGSYFDEIIYDYVMKNKDKFN